MAVKHVSVLDWKIVPFRGEAFYKLWKPACERALSFGAKSWSLTRSEDNPLIFRQTIVWDRKSDFENYWASDEISRAREEVMSYYDKPLLPAWFEQLAAE